jgi:hypothetical protein
MKIETVKVEFKKYTEKVLKVREVSVLKLLRDIKKNNKEVGVV